MSFDNLNVMPDYLMDDLPEWLKEKNAGRSSRSRSGRGNAKSLVPDVQIPVETPSVNKLMARYIDYLKPNLDLLNPGASDMSTGTVKSNKPPNAELKLAKQLLAQLHKRSMRLREAALAAMKASDDGEEEVKKRESDADIFERELEAKIAMFRRDPSTWKHLLLTGKKKIQYENEQKEIARAKAAAARLEEDEEEEYGGGDGADSAGQFAARAPRADIEVQPEAEPATSLEVCDTLNKMSKSAVETLEEETVSTQGDVEATVSTMAMKGNDKRTAEAHLAPQTPSRPKPSTTRPRAVDEGSGARKTPHRPSNSAVSPRPGTTKKYSQPPDTPRPKKPPSKHSSLVSKADLDRRDLAVRTIERRAIQKFYLTMVAMFSRNNFLVEKLELERLKNYIAGSTRRLTLILRLQLMVKARYRVKQEKRMAKAMRTLVMHLSVFMASFLRKLKTKRIVIVRSFLQDFMSHSQLQRVMKLYRFKVMKCQRWVREYFAISKYRVRILALYMETKCKFARSEYGTTLSYRDRYSIAKKYLYQRRRTYRKKYEETKSLVAGRVDAFEQLTEEGARDFLLHGRPRRVNPQTNFVEEEGYDPLRPKLSLFKAKKKVGMVDLGNGTKVNQMMVPQVAPTKLMKSKIRDTPFFVLFKHDETIPKLQAMGQELIDEREMVAAAAAAASAAQQMSGEVNMEEVEEVLKNVDVYIATSAGEGENARDEFGVPPDGKGVRRHTRLSAGRAGVAYIAQAKAEVSPKKPSSPPKVRIPGYACGEDD